MENNEFEKVRIKNRTCYYFHDIIKFGDSDFITWNFTRNKYWYVKFHIKFWLFQNHRVYDGIRYLVLFGPEKTRKNIFNSIRYLKYLEISRFCTVLEKNLFKPSAVSRSVLTN